jgi:uncharacterized protein YjgD (DUF1641 family)
MNSFENFKSQVEATKKEIFSEIESLINQMEESGDVDKFYEKGIKSAAGRLRKSLQLVKKSIHMPTIKGKMTDLSNAAKNLREELGA